MDMRGLTDWAGGTGLPLQSAVGVPSGGTPTQFPDRLSVISVTYAQRSTPTSGTINDSTIAASQWPQSPAPPSWSARPATRSAVPWEPVARGRSNEVRANPAINADAIDIDVYLMLPFFLAIPRAAQSE